MPQQPPPERNASGEEAGIQKAEAPNLTASPQKSQMTEFKRLAARLLQTDPDEVRKAAGSWKEARGSRFENGA